MSPCVQKFQRNLGFPGGIGILGLGGRVCVAVAHGVYEGRRGVLALQLVLGTSLGLPGHGVHESRGDLGRRDGSTKKIIDFCLD